MSEGGADADLDGGVARTARAASARRGRASRCASSTRTARSVPTGETGVIYVRPPGGVGFRYHDDPTKTASAWRDDAFTVGDVGHLDADGYLYLTDRASDMVIRGGVNVYPREIEEVLYTHPAVVDCAVFGVPDERLGEQLHAVVEVRDADRHRTSCAAHCSSAPRRLQGAGDGRARRRAPASAQRQGPQAPAPRPPLGRPGHEHLGRRLVRR